MLRRVAPLVLALSVCPAALSDDLPPWMQPTQPAGTATSTTATPAAAADSETFGELLALQMSAEDAKRLRGDDAARRAAWLAERWSKLPPHEQAQVRFAGEKLRENGSVAHARSLTLLVLGPPQSMHSEPARTWKGEPTETLADLASLPARLRAGQPAAGATMSPLTGEIPTEIWVYPGHSVNEVRVVTFVDDDRDGGFRFASDRVVPVSPAPSSVPGVEPPPELFPPVQAASEIAALPELTKDGLPVRASQSFFKASAGRTFTRFLLAIDPLDIELEIDGVPADFAATAEAHLRVEQGGAAAWQGSVKLADSGATAAEPWLIDLSIPLLPGKYEATGLVRDAAGAGGKVTWSLEVPAFAGALSLSSPVVALAVDGTLPKAPETEDESLAPFQIGNFIVRPVVGATFKRGQSAAFVVQVYGDAPQATIEYDLYADGVYQTSIEPTPIQSLPSTQITVQDIAKVYRDASYELRVTVKNPKNAEQVAKVNIPFRVQG